MQTDPYVRAAWIFAALSLGAIAARPYLEPTPVRAETAAASNLYIEPGVHTIRLAEGAGEVSGKVVVDLRNGNVWGYPTGMKLPYPVSLGNETAVSHPVYLGKFDFAGLQKRP
jgi:hypothetical protein